MEISTQIASLSQTEITMQPKILLADDHSMIRKGLKLHLQLTLGYTDIEEVATCNELMNESSPYGITWLSRLPCFTAEDIL